MEKTVRLIDRAVHQFETVLLPRLPLVSTDPRDAQELNKRLVELRRIQQEASQPPVFSVRFLGDTQNGKSTLINVLLGRKVLPEGHVGACSATIVRCRYKQKPQITIELRYCSSEDFTKDLENKLSDAEGCLEANKGDEAQNRKSICDILGRFLGLFGIEPSEIHDLRELIGLVRSSAADFPSRQLLGTTETLNADATNEKRIHESLSARGRSAFLVDECLIEGSFEEWHPAMELVDMPGTNAFNPYDDQVNSRLKQKGSGLAIVTKENQLHDSVMEWFREDPILREVAGASERNQVRVFVLKTFIDQLNLPEDDDGKSEWEKTREYCAEIEVHLRRQVMSLVGQQFSAENEVEVLQRFVKRMPVFFLSPRVFRNLADDGLRKRVLNDPKRHKAMDAAFDRFDRQTANTGVPSLREEFYRHTEDFINTHFANKLRLDFEKEVGRVARFFRSQRVVIEQRLANESEFIHEVNQGLHSELIRCIGSHLEATETQVVSRKRRFQEEVGSLLDQVSVSFANKVQERLQVWMHLNWASLRCAGRKNGHHMTARGYEIDFNGTLADFCVMALNSSWIAHRNNLRKQFFDSLRVQFIPEMQMLVSQAKGHDPARISLIESTYEDVVDFAKQNLDLKLAEYDAEAEAFDSLRPSLALAIRDFLRPTYAGISSEIGQGSSARMRNHLNAGVTSSIPNIGRMVKDVVKGNWEGLTAALENGINAFFQELKDGLEEQSEHLKKLAEHPSDGDEQRASHLLDLEKKIASWIEKEAA